MAAQQPPRSDADDDARLTERLREMGAQADELEEAERTGTLGPLALELALRGPGEVITFEEAARRAGVELDQAARAWRIVGFPDPLAAPLHLAVRQVDTLRLLVGTEIMFGTETAGQLGRVLGSTIGQLAEAVVDAFRVRVEMPRRDSGEPVSEVVADYARTAAEVVPRFVDAIGDVLAGHMVMVARASWGLDEKRATVTRQLAIGFADLVDYTAAARALSPSELAGAIARFEDLGGEIVARHGGRVVKLIGDEIMFAVEQPAQAARVAVELLEAVRSDPELPEVRIGLAAGSVVSVHGDYYGDTVNLASRLVAAAEPGTALATEAIAAHAAAEPAELPLLKGYDRPVEAWRLLPR